MLYNRRTLLKAGASGVALTAYHCATPPRSPKEVERFGVLRGHTAGAAPLERADHLANFKRVQSAVKNAGLAALVVEAGYSLFHFSGVYWYPSERPFLLIVRADGAPRWVVPAFEEKRARERAGDDADIAVWQEHEDPYAAAQKVIGAGGVAVGPEMRDFVVRGLARGLAREVTSGAAIVESVRAIKTDKELALLDRANLATKAALGEVMKSTKPGMKEGELKRLILEAQSVAGLERVWALVLFGANAAFPHGSGQEQTLADGDLILVDTGGSLHGYCSDITRTWPCGRPSDDQRRAYNTVLEAQSAAFEILKPGVRCADVDAAARKVISDAGYGTNYDKFTHRLGHGIGLEGHEAPYLVRGNQRVLEPGMTMSNEPGIYVYGKFGVRIEDILAITPDGHKIFGERAAPLT